MKHSEEELQGIYDSIANPTPPKDVRRKSSPFDGARRKFLRVYKGPGYPVDPRLETGRCLDAWVNAFTPGPSRTYDFGSIRHWLLEKGN